MSKPPELLNSLLSLSRTVRACTLCDLPHQARPVFSAHPQAKIAIIGQAPGAKVHASGVPWDDPSGDRLRTWLGVDSKTFYDPARFAIIPMGFCYPGKGRSGDLPPRPECAPKWHAQLFSLMPNIQLRLLFGKYALDYYLGDLAKKTLTETVRSWADRPKSLLVLPHPSPRNNIWMARNPWFETELIPELRKRVSLALETSVPDMPL